MHKILFRTLKPKICPFSLLGSVPDDPFQHAGLKAFQGPLDKPTYVSIGDAGSLERRPCSNLLLFFNGSGRDKFRAFSFFLELYLSVLLRRLEEAMGNTASPLHECLSIILILSASIFRMSAGEGLGDFCIPRSAKAASCSAFILLVRCLVVAILCKTSYFMPLPAATGLVT